MGGGLLLVVIVLIIFIRRRGKSRARLPLFPASAASPQHPTTSAQRQWMGPEFQLNNIYPTSSLSAAEPVYEIPLDGDGDGNSRTYSVSIGRNTGVGTGHGSLGAWDPQHYRIFTGPSTNSIAGAGNYQGLSPLQPQSQWDPNVYRIFTGAGQASGNAWTTASAGAAGNNYDLASSSSSDYSTTPGTSAGGPREQPVFYDVASPSNPLYDSATQRQGADAARPRQRSREEQSES